MRLDIDGGGYSSAHTAFGEANQLAARLHQRLLQALADTGGMAGDDSTSQEFAAAYDQGAAEAFAALADLVGSFAGLGRLTAASLSNHAMAEARSVVGGAPVYDGGWMPEIRPDTGYVALLPASPPTALGNNEHDYGHLVGWVLDHVQGFVWPDADTDRLREAAVAWRVAATGIADLGSACDCAVRGFWRELSTEVPVAIEATHELRRTLDDLADRYAALGLACGTYADQVDAKREEVVRLAESVLEQCVEGIAISVGLGLLTGGAGAWGGGTATAARVASEAPRFLEILTSLRALSASAADSVRATREALAASRGVLAKFKDASLARSAALGERGEMRLWWRKPGWLSRHETGPGHTLRNHVAQSERQLARRFAGPHAPPFASTFRDQAAAERLIADVLDRRIESIDDWLASGQRRLRLDGMCNGFSGTTMDSSGALREVSGIRVVLQRDPSMPDGYRIITAFPQP